jgi:hypothetical protein
VAPGVDECHERAVVASRGRGEEKEDNKGVLVIRVAIHAGTTPLGAMSAKKMTPERATSAKRVIVNGC